jgi:hypothetical protein
METQKLQPRQLGLGYEYELSPFGIGFLMWIDSFSSKISTWFPDLDKINGHGYLPGRCGWWAMTQPNNYILSAHPFAPNRSKKRKEKLTSPAP